jgi:hypothetical protein
MEGAMRLLWTPRRIRIQRDLRRLAVVKRWQQEERDAARCRLIELAATTPDPVRARR